MAGAKGLSELQSWAYWMDQRLSSRFKLPPSKWEFILDPCPTEPIIVVFDSGWEITILSRRLGEYEHDFIGKGGTIRVWLLDPNGWPFNIEDIQNVWLHEYLHYYDDMKGLGSPPGDHNDIFTQRLKDLGLWVGNRPGPG